MEFSVNNLFEFLEDTSIIWASFWSHFVIFTTPYLLPIVDFGIRTYIWIQDLSFFQQNKCKYAEILASESWNYTGFLVRTKTSNPFYPEYTMIHHYDLNQDLVQVKDKIDTLYLTQEQNVCICRRNAFVFAKIKRSTSTSTSNIRFLYIELINKGITISLDIPDEMMQIGNELFTSAFIYRLLDHQSRSFVFDLEYHLVIVDEHLNTTNIDSRKYIVLEKDNYRVQYLSVNSEVSK